MAADETDFLDLYGKLRLQPDCSLADFKQAYRRHVSAWHPDRRSRGVRADALAARRLQRLMAQYSAAMDFHKRHGRLPGAARPTPNTTVVPITPNLPAVIQPPCTSALARDSEAPEAELTTKEPAETIVPEVSPIARERAPAGGRAVWLAGLVVVGTAVWALIPETDNVDPLPEGVPAVIAEPATQAAQLAQLGIGMKDDEVMAVEGEPTLRGPDRWEYGPSWVRFEGGSVVDWYSSPLRTLHVRSSHPKR